MLVGDKVVVKTDVIREIKNPQVRSMYAGEGRIIRDFKTGYYSVRFLNRKTGAWMDGGAYGYDLVVVEKGK